MRDPWSSTCKSNEKYHFFQIEKHFCFKKSSNLLKLQERILCTIVYNVFIGATRRSRPATRRWRRHSGRTRHRSSWTGRAPLSWRSSNSSRPITYRFENRFLEEQTAHRSSFRWTIQWPSSHRTKSRASPSSRPSSSSKIQKRSDFFFFKFSIFFDHFFKLFTFQKILMLAILESL